MKLPNFPVTLKHGVGRRILGYFVIAGILPVAFTAALAFHEFGRGLNEEVNRDLREHAKDYGLDLLTRLQHLSASVDQMAIVVKEDGREGLAENQYLTRNVQAAWLVSDGSRPVMLHGDSVSAVPRERVEYGPYGQARVFTAGSSTPDTFSPLGNPYQFQGHRLDVGTRRQQIPQAGDRALVDQGGERPVVLVLAGLHRRVQRRDHVRVVGVVLAAVDVLQQAAGGDRTARVPGLPELRGEREEDGEVEDVEEHAEARAGDGQGQERAAEDRDADQRHRAQAG